MNKKIKFLKLFSLLFVLLFVFLMPWQQGKAANLQDPFGINGGGGQQGGASVTIEGIAQSVAKVVWTVAVFITVVLWLVTGFLFLKAQGDPGQLKTARTALFTSIAGTAIVILAWSAMSIVDSAIFSGT